MSTNKINPASVNANQQLNKFKKVDSEFTAIETRYGSGYRWNVS